MLLSAALYRQVALSNSTSPGIFLYFGPTWSMVLVYLHVPTIANLWVAWPHNLCGSIVEVSWQSCNRFSQTCLQTSQLTQPKTTPRWRRPINAVISCITIVTITSDWAELHTTDSMHCWSCSQTWSIQSPRSFYSYPCSRSEQSTPRFFRI